MKKLLEIEISEQLDAQIAQGMKVSELSEAEVVQAALSLGLAQFSEQPSAAPKWLEERVLLALQEPAEEMTLEEFRREMDEIAQGR